MTVGRQVKVLLSIQTALLIEISAAWCGVTSSSRAAEGQSDITPAILKLYDQGFDDSECGAFPEAIETLTKVLQSAPDFHTAVEQLSIAYSRQADSLDHMPARALRNYDRALYYNPTNPLAKLRSAQMILNLGKNGKQSADRIALGDSALADKDYQAAVVEYEAAMAIQDNAAVKEKLNNAATLAGSRPPIPKKIDFGDYMSKLQKKIKSNWKPPHAYLTQQFAVTFDVDRLGNVHDLHFSKATGIPETGQSGLNAVEAAAPFAPLPLGAPRVVTINFNFDYNNRSTIRPMFTAVSESYRQQLSRKSEEDSLKGEITQLEKSKDEPDSKTNLIKTVDKLAERYEEWGRDADAEQLLDRAIELEHGGEQGGEPSTSLVKSLNELAKLYCRAGAFDRAEPLLKQSIAAGQANPHLGIYVLSQSYRQYAGLLACTGHKDQSKEFLVKAEETVRQPGPSLDEYTQAISQNPEDATNYFLRGDLYFRKSQWDDAIADYSRAIKLNPGYAMAYAHRGNACHQAKRDSDALADLAQAIALAPDCLAAYRVRAKLYLDQKEWDLSIKDATEALKIGGKDFDSLNTRGLALTASRQYKEAISDFDEAIKLKPEEASAYANKGRTLIEAKDDELALDSLNKALRLDASNGAAYANRGLALAHLHQYQQSLPDYERALALRPDDANIHLNHGHALLFCKQFEAANQEFNQAIKLRPDYALAYSNRSCSQWTMQNYQAALDDADKAITLDGKLAPAYCNRGKSHLSLKQYDAALADFSKAIELESGVLGGEAYFYRAKAYALLDRAGEAAADRKKADILDYKPLVGD